MMDMARHQVKICLVIWCYLMNSILGGPHERRLLKHLLTEQQHDPLERPVRNDSQTLPVSINLALQQIIDFDEKNEVLIITGWMVLMWQDYSMTWNPKEYGNIQAIRVPSSHIWTPDVLLYNSAEENFDSRVKINAVVQHNGDVLYVPPGIFKSICPFNIASFPFVSVVIFHFVVYVCILLDTQNCTLKFGSWTFDDSGINLTAPSNKGQLDAYTKNAEWDLEDFSAVNNALKYDCCPDLYPFVLFTIRIRRRSLYYFTNAVVPCFLITCMTIFGYLLAPESGEKLTLQITILLSIVMFSLLISGIMPPSSTAIPTITLYFMWVMCMSTISVGASVLVISLHFRTANSHTMPLWVRKYICHYLAWLLWMKRPGHDLTWRGIRRQWSSPDEQQDGISKPIGGNDHKSPSAPLLVDMQPLPSPGDREQKRSGSILDVTTSPVSKFQCLHHDHDPSNVLRSCDADIIRYELRTIVSQVAALTHCLRRQGEHDDVSQNWQFVAMVIDRLCLIIFSISMIIFTSLTLLSEPNFFKFQ